jgi:deoxyribose-phosphate aldolase
MHLTEKTLAKMIDQSYLKPNATVKEILKFCEIVRKYNFKAAYVLPTNVPILVKELKNTKIKVATAIGFPFGANFPKVKAFEAEKMIEAGAEEIDMVINIGALKSGNYKLVYDDIKRVVDAAQKVITKIILETYYLTDDEIVKGCQISKDAGADFVKTCTGFTPTGAKLEHIKLMRKTVGAKMGVKASGKIWDIDTCLNMIKAGANRIGVSKGEVLIDELREKYNGSYEIEETKEE